MVDLVEVLTICQKYYDTMGDVWGSYFIENELFKGTEIEKNLPKTKEIYEELKRLAPIWNKQYGIDANTKVSEVIAKIKNS